MVHILVLILFTESIFFSLVFYDQTKYAFIVSILFSLFVCYKVIFHIKHQIIFILLLIITTILLSQYFMLRVNYLDSKYKDGFIFKHQQSIDLLGEIKTFPGYRFSNNQYVITINDGKTNILLSTDMYQKFSYGDTLILKGKVQDVREQDIKWHQYYKKLNVQYTVFNPQIAYLNTIDTRTYYESVMLKLFYFKNLLRSVVIDIFSSHTSALILGMLLGEKDELSKEEKEVFNKVGLSHILVVSGYNISLLISFIFIVFKYINKKIRIGIALLLIILFVLLIGGEGSVMRAALMGSIIIFSRITNRPSSAVNVLFLVATIMLFYNPFFIFDAGFHLSFIATFSLLVFPNLKKIPEFISTTIWVFIFVTPYILYLSGYMSFGSILSNVLVIALLPVFMFVSLFSIVLGVFNVYVGVDVLILESIARYIFIVSNTIKDFARIKINIAPPVLVVLYSLVCVLFIFYKNKYTTLEFIEKHYQKFVPQRPN